MTDNPCIVTKEDWEIYPMPEKNASFVLKMHFDKNELENLKRGHCPEEMEDRWFSYFEDGRLYVHRSWSGHCIFIVEFGKLFDRHRVTVNRDENQYTGSDTEEERETLSSLLSYWSK